MAVTRTLVRAIARPGMSPAEILKQVNTELCRDNEACFFVTMILGIVDVTSGEVVCGLGGHNAPVHLTREDAVFGPLGGTPLGIMPQAKFAEWRPDLAPGDMLLVYTDGVPEALDESCQLFTNERFLAVLRNKVPSSSRGLVADVEQAVAAFVGGAERSDDVTLMVLHRRP
jgi:sigma-B regulation protein RsbU (phosphoserine phosphatase)